LPVYVYRCDDCGAEVEKRQSFDDAPLTECERCHGHLRKLFLPTPIVFKGSGFYATDHRSPSGMTGGNGSAHKDGDGTHGGSASKTGASTGSGSSASSDE